MLCQRLLLFATREAQLAAPCAKGWATALTGAAAGSKKLPAHIPASITTLPNPSGTPAAARTLRHLTSCTSRHAFLHPLPWSAAAASRPTQQPLTAARTFVSFPDLKRIPLNFTTCILAFNVLVFAGQQLTRQALTLKFMKSNFHIANGELWRLITPVFLHADIFHLLINTYSLYNLGTSLEPTAGTPRFATIYLISTITGNLCSYFMNRGNAVGASTALFGLLGAEAMILLRNQDVFANTSDSLNQIGLMLLINMAYGWSNSRVDNYGHLGGLLGGLAAAWALGPTYVRGKWGGWVDKPPVDIFGSKRK